MLSIQYLVFIRICSLMRVIEYSVGLNFCLHFFDRRAETVDLVVKLARNSNYGMQFQFFDMYLKWLSPCLFSFREIIIWVKLLLGNSIAFVLKSAIHHSVSKCQSICICRNGLKYKNTFPANMGSGVKLSFVLENFLPGWTWY